MCVLWLSVSVHLSLVLGRSESEMEGEGLATYLLNMLVGSSNLRTATSNQLLLGYRRGEKGERPGFEAGPVNPWAL